jgi:hypothetical protein
MMAALALAASAGTGNAVAVMPREPSSPSLPTVRPRKRRSHKRLNARVSGGNWQGVPYLSYAEHDRCVRKTLGMSLRKSRDFAYRSELEAIISSR